MSGRVRGGLVRWFIPCAVLVFFIPAAIMHGGGSRYDSHGRRNPFLPSVEGPSRPGGTGEGVDTAAIEAWFGRSLGGIIWDAKTPYALIGDKIVEAGQEVRGCRIVEIKPEGIVFEYLGKRVEVPLRIDKKEKNKDDAF